MHWLAAGLISIAGLETSPAVHAQDATAASTQKEYRIPAGSLTQALALFTQAADVSLSYDPAVTQGKSSPGLSGSYTIATGFAKLLEGSRLSAERLASGYVLRPIPAVAVAIAPTPSVAPAVTLSPVTVTGEPIDAGYTVAAESLATGTPTLLQQIPQSVQVVPGTIIQDQQASTFFDIVHNVGGMNDNPAATSWGMDSYELRGFDARLQLDGIAYQTLFNFPAVAIDRVEVLKGVDSTLVGDMAPSGSINVVTKQPQRDPVREITMQAGSFGNVGTTLDLAGTAPSDQRLQYRIIMSVEKANENFAGYRDMRHIYLAPSVAWDDGVTRLALGVQYTHGRAPQWPYTILVNGRPADLSGHIDNEDEHTDFNWLRTYYQFSHKLNADWSIRSNLSVSQQSATQYSYLTVDPDENGDAYYLPYTQAFKQRNVDTDNSLAGKFATGSITHQVVFGFAYSKFNETQHAAEGAAYLQSNIFDPRVPFPSPGTDGSTIDGDGITSTLQVYAQDFMSFGKRWRLMTAAGFHFARENGSSEQGWTPQLGVSYDVSDRISIYGHSSRSFSAQPYILQDGSLAPPSKGKVIEGGVKFHWPDKPLDLSIGVFHASQDNLAQVAPDLITYTLTPGGSSRGVELNLQGQLAENWKVIASYTYTDFQAADGQLNQFPRHIASLWATYSFQNEALRNWGIGAGVYARSYYNGDNSGLDSFWVPGQARTDMSLFYRGRRFSATLGVKNLFNRTLYSGHDVGTQMYLEPSRTVMLTTAYKF